MKKKVNPEEYCEYGVETSEKSEGYGRGAFNSRSDYIAYKEK